MNVMPIEEKVDIFSTTDNMEIDVSIETSGENVYPMHLSPTVQSTKKSYPTVTLKDSSDKSRGFEVIFDKKAAEDNWVCLNFILPEGIFFKDPPFLKLKKDMTSWGWKKTEPPHTEAYIKVHNTSPTPWNSNFTLSLQYPKKNQSLTVDPKLGGRRGT